MILSGAIQDESTPNGKRWKECINITKNPLSGISFYDYTDYDNAILMATSNGLYYRGLMDDNKKVERHKNSPNEIFTVLSSKDGAPKMWAATKTGKIYYSPNMFSAGGYDSSNRNASWSFVYQTKGTVKKFAVSSKTDAVVCYDDKNYFYYSVNGTTWIELSITVVNPNSIFIKNINNIDILMIGTDNGVIFYNLTENKKEGSPVGFTKSIIDEKYGTNIVCMGESASVFYQSNNVTENTWEACSGESLSTGKEYLYIDNFIVAKDGTEIFQIVSSHTKIINCSSKLELYLKTVNKIYNQYQGINVLYNDNTIVCYNSYYNGSSSWTAETHIINYEKGFTPLNIMRDSSHGTFLFCNEGLIEGDYYKYSFFLNFNYSTLFQGGNLWLDYKYYSLDGKTWQENSLILNNDIYYLGGIYFCNITKYSSSGNDYYSLDGLNWKPMRKFYDISYNGSGTWVLSGPGGFYWSNDGIAWTKESTGFTTNGVTYSLIYYGGGMWIGENGYSYAYYSTDGIEWKQTNLKLGNSSGAALNNSYYYSENLGIWLTWRSVGTNNMWGYSTNGITWTIARTDCYITRITEGNNAIIIATNNDNYYYYLYWNSGNIDMYNNFGYVTRKRKFYYNDGIWLSLKIENNTKLIIQTYTNPLQTSDLIKEFSIQSTKTLSLSDFVVEYFKGTWFIQDKVNLKNYYSKDSSTWKETDKGPNFKLSKAINNNGIIVARGTNGQMYYSESLV